MFCAACRSFRLPCKNFCLHVSVFCAVCRSFRLPCKNFCLHVSVFCAVCSNFCLHVSVFRAVCSSFRLPCKNFCLHVSVFCAVCSNFCLYQKPPTVLELTRRELLLVCKWVVRIELARKCPKTSCEQLLPFSCEG